MRDNEKKTVYLLIIALFLCAGPGCEKEDAGGDPAERARQEIIKSLPLYPDAVQRRLEASQGQDALILSYGTKEDTEDLSKFFKRAVSEKGYKMVMGLDNGLTYKDPAGRLVTIMWFPRDPDVSDYRSVFHVSVKPLPPELKKKQEAGE